MVQLEQGKQAGLASARVGHKVVGANMRAAGSLR